MGKRNWRRIAARLAVLSVAFGGSVLVAEVAIRRVAPQPLLTVTPGL